MSPALSGRSALQRVKLGDVLKICDGRFLFGLPQMNAPVTIVVINGVTILLF